MEILSITVSFFSPSKVLRNAEIPRKAEAQPGTAGAVIRLLALSAFLLWSADRLFSPFAVSLERLAEAPRVKTATSHFTRGWRCPGVAIGQIKGASILRERSVNAEITHGSARS